MSLRAAGVDRFCQRPMLSSIPLVFKRWMIMTLPPKVTSRLMNGLRNIAEIRSHVMLESLTANVLQEFLKLRNLRHTRSAECFEWILREAPRAGVPPHYATPIVGRKTRKAHRARLHAADARTKRVLLA